MTALLLAGVGVLIANLAVLGLTLKLYTEFFKQAAQMTRRDAHLTEGTPE